MTGAVVGMQYDRSWCKLKKHVQLGGYEKLYIGKNVYTVNGHVMTILPILKFQANHDLLRCNVPYKNSCTVLFDDFNILRDHFIL